MLAIAIHSHEFGNDGYIFIVDDSKPLPTEEEVAQQLGIDFDSDREELMISSVSGTVEGGVPTANSFSNLLTVKS